MHNSPGHYISSIYRHLQIHLNAQFAALGFGSGQYLFFNHISRNEGISQKELSSSLAIDKATTAKAVHKLTALGFIVQKQNPDDRRYNNLYLTDEGKAITPEVRDILSSTRSLLQNGMNDDERDQSLRLLELMLDNILRETGRGRSSRER